MLCGAVTLCGAALLGSTEAVTTGLPERLGLAGSAMLGLEQSGAVRSGGAVWSRNVAGRTEAVTTGLPERLGLTGAATLGGGCAGAATLFRAVLLGSTGVTMGLQP